MAAQKRRPRRPREAVIPKDRLAAEVARILKDEELTQREAAWRVRGAPSQISLIALGKTHRVSADRLIRILVRLGRHVDIVVKKAKGKSGRVRVTPTRS